MYDGIAWCPPDNFTHFLVPGLQSSLLAMLEAYANFRILSKTEKVYLKVVSIFLPGPVQTIEKEWILLSEKWMDATMTNTILLAYMKMKDFVLSYRAVEWNAIKIRFDGAETFRDLERDGAPS